MKRYANISRNSGVLAYEIDSDSIEIKFIDGRVYRYSYNIPGKRYVEQMKILAKKGKGLSGYISKYVKDRYDKI